MPFGGVVKLTGESEYRAALQRCTAGLKDMSDALRNQADRFEVADGKLTRSKADQDALNKSIENQSAAIDDAKNALSNYSVQLTAQQTKHQALQREYKNAVTELEKIRKASGESSDEFKNQQKRVDDLGDALADSTRSMDESKAAMNNLKRTIADAESAMDEAAKSSEDLGKEVEDSGKKANGAGEGGWSKFNQVVANLATQAINAAITGIRNLANALIDVGKQAIESYADFEQLSGGVEKIFGADTAKSVQENASRAFESAGLSANAYMETVTGFSAALINGLEGDTAEAARLADVAIRDMSDNANTFGVSMDTLQAAYSGFARNTFTMLDSLKLGYGGSQEGMIALINDSGILNEEISSLDGITFDQMISAIHEVQTQLGITGTTAEEAAHTIQGSLGAMRGAWANLLTGMADENADIEELVGNFVDTLVGEDGQSGVIGNLAPRIVAVINGISTMIINLVPTLIETLIPIIANAFPAIVQAVSNGLSTIVALLPDLIPVVFNTIMDLVNQILEMTPELLDCGMQIILSLIEGIGETVPKLIEMLPDIMIKLVDTLLQGLPLIIDAALQMILALVNGLMNAIPKLIDYVPTLITTIIEVLINNLPRIIEMAVQIMVALITGLIDAIPQLIAMVPKIIRAIVNTLKENWPQIKEGGKQILQAFLNGWSSIFSKVGEAAKKIWTTIKTELGNIGQKMLDIGKNVVQGIWNGISNSLQWIKNKISGWIGNVLDFIKRIFGIASPSKVMEDEVGKYLAEGIGVGFTDEMRNVSQDMANAIPSSFDVDTTVSGGSAQAAQMSGMVDAFKQALEEMKIELDDEIAGRFVEKTVARAIYT